jgi:PAS domain S-box-containing protein
MISVLYVDDEPALLDLTKMFLERMGNMSVDVADSARKALAMMEAKRYDVIVSDYQMPGMDGIALLREIRRKGNTIPFIIFTGKGREEVVIEAYESGADFYIQKGGEPRPQFAELERKISRAVELYKAGHERLETEERLRQIIQFLPDATFAIDTEGKVIAWNRAMERMTGVPAGDILGKGNFEYALPFYRERRPILIDLVLKNDPETEAKYPYIRRVGTKLYSEITIPHMNKGKGAALWFTASPLYDTQGRICGAIESIRDITDRKKAEVALAESEKRFRELAEMTPQVIFEMDREMTLTYANRKASELFGYTEEDFDRGLSALQMIAPEDRERAGEAIQRVFAGEAPRTLPPGEYTAIRKDGSTFPVTIYSAPIVSGAEVTGLRGIIADNTARKAFENAIRESERLYRTIFETTGTATVLIESDGTISLANSEFVRLSGLPREEIENRKTWMDFVVREDLERMVAQHHLRRSDPEKALKNYEFRFVTATGEIRHIYLSVNLIPGTRKSVASLLDITPRKKAEEALVEANKDYNALLDQIQDVYYRSDTEGRLVKASRSWAVLLGYDDVAECIGRPIAEDFYANPADREKLLEEIYRNGRVTNYEVTLRKKDGTPVVVSTNSYLVHGPDGTVLGVEGTFRDITGQIRARDELRRSEERFRLIFSTVPSAVVVYEAVDNGEDFIIRDFNPRAEEIERLARKDVVGRRVTEVFPGVREFGLLPVFRQVWKTGQAAYFPPALYRDHRDPGTWRENWVYKLTSGEIVAIYRDVTSWVRAQEDLRKSEERYHHIIESQTEFICRFLPDGTHVFVNRAYADYFGMTPEEMTGRVFRPAIHPDDRKRVREFFASLTPDHPAGTIEHRIIMPDGGVRWQQWSDRAIFGEDGRLVEYQSVGRDITEQKRAMEDLERYRQRLEAAMDLAHMAYWEFDIASGILTFNDRFYALYGTTAEREGGYQMPAEVYAREFVHPDDAHMVAEEVEKAQSANSSDFLSIRQHRIIRRDGQVRWIVVRIGLIRDGSGRPVKTHGVNQDITEMKRAEEALREREERFQRLAENAEDLVYRYELFPARGYTYVSPSATKITGYTPEEHYADPDLGFKIALEEDRPLLEALARGEDAAAIKRPLELRMRRKDGSVFWTELVNVPILDAQGRVVAVEGIARDITERKRIEDALRTANRKLNLLSSLTRHDIANQLTVIQGYATLLAEEQPGPGVLEKTGVIQGAAGRIAAMIRFTKDYENIGVELPVWHDVRSLVDSVVAEVDRGNVRLINDIPEKTEIFADLLIRRVWFNLVDNAVRHGEKVTAIRFFVEEKEDGLSIVCEDDGTGIPAGEKEKIFERGYGKNTGMGLFLSREILAITGITISENGEPGKGARFEIRVPPGKFRKASAGP